MRKLVLLATVAPVLAIAGCASNSDVEQLRQEIASVRATAEAADQKATNAQQTAQQALEQSRLANEKADRIFREGLRK
jgi:outer membrane murein-binding lipoprotein Lpp